MKNFVLIICFLAISYAIDPEEVKKFYRNYAICVQELNVPKLTPKVIKCTLQKFGTIDEQGLIVKERLFKIFEKIISETNLPRAKDLASTCIEQEYQSPITEGNNDEKTLAFIKCGILINDLIEKPL
ncbi:hypothetical protein CAJAP_10341 [Camponotus japonicus]